MFKVADWPENFAKCVPLSGDSVTSKGFLSRWINQNKNSLLIALKSEIFKGFEARVAGNQPNKKNERLAADSDFYKWIEGASYIFARDHDKDIKNALDHAASLITSCQETDGYINTQVPPRKRFDTEINHDLYLAGHFFEAAVAHHQATGDDQLLSAACKWADYLFKTYKDGHSYFETVGTKEHPVYELGLLRLYRATRNEKYLNFALELTKLCKVTNTIATTIAGDGELHAVRLGYLLSACADLYLETGDSLISKDLDSLWTELVNTRMYTTGAIGSHGEIISKHPFDLPHTQDHPHRTMGETCAAIAMIMFSWRMHSINGKGTVFDIVERILYNHVLGSLSLDSLGHFYYNPMQMIGDQSLKTDHWHQPSSSRCRLPELNRTTCCMPNLWRFFGALPEYIFSKNKDSLYVNLYTDSSVSEIINDNKIEVSISTQYPNEGKSIIRYNGSQPASFNLNLRIPVWAHNTILTNPNKTKSAPNCGEYFSINRTWQQNDTVILEFDMQPRIVFQDTRVKANANSIVLARGPLQYCLEQEDINFPVEDAGTSLVSENIDQKVKTNWNPELLGGIHSLTIPGWQKKPTNPVKLTLIPWYARANRSDNSRWIIHLPYADHLQKKDMSTKEIDSKTLHSLSGNNSWNPYPENPILVPGIPPSWDSWNIATMSVLEANDTFHMYYEAGVTGVEDFQIGHATSRDGINWVKDNLNPVIPFGAGDAWDNKETWDPFVIYEDGIFKMWYGGTTYEQEDPQKRDFQMGYATSTDGSTFKNRRKISNFSNRENGLGQIADMHVVHDRIKHEYVLFYYGIKDGLATLRRTTSINETDFDFSNSERVDIKGDAGPYRSAHVIIERGIWHMYYGFKYKNRSGYATSSDGFNWEAQNYNIINGHDPEILRLNENICALYYCPSQYNMGHEASCDIRVALNYKPLQ